MKRRDFLRRAIPATMLPFGINGFSLAAYGRPPFREPVLADGAPPDRVLVLIQLNGGNDGINTLIPLDQYATYYDLRSNIAIPEDRVLRLTDRTGLHPAASGLKTLYDGGKLCIVQGVSYPNPNLSHFRATDIWLTASDYNQYLSNGWMGRYLDFEFQGYPGGYPNEEMPDPLAIQIASVASIGFQGPSQSMAVTLQDPNTFYRLVSGSTSGGEDEVPQTPAGRELAYIRQIGDQSVRYAARVKAAADRAKNRSSLYPAAGRNALADQLKVVARLIGGGLKTRMYLVSMGGFDNHSNQAVSGETTTGTHATLLGNLAAAALAFQDDIELLGAGHRVIAMTFSEFGRRVVSNGSLGTDHGTAAPMFLFGGMVRPGIAGSNPSLTDLTSGNLKTQYDYRTVYAAVLNQWFGVPAVDLDAVLLKEFQPLELMQRASMFQRRRPVEIVPE